jgi:hypothetical protein
MDCLPNFLHQQWQQLHVEEIGARPVKTDVHLRSLYLLLV